jgi:thioredoxin reductase (NADPH)
MEVTACAVVLALGVEYRRLEAPGLAELEGAGVYYGAAMSEARAVEGEDVAVVGGGNSAGQAALHLARYAQTVSVLVRGDTLASSMSHYLIEALEETPNVEIRYRTAVVGATGRGRLESLELESDGDRETMPAAALFVLIGARPRTEWLPDELERDEWGYVVTGASKETTMPGVFAAGDVTARSVKRVASAVGSGALAISGVHAYLADASSRWPARS